MTQMSQVGYRADIDGLRAIAVLSVVLHHLQPTAITGGYVGVDIFFVISGYLITSQLAEDLVSGRFSISAFYQRRINRILPALLVVVVSTCSIGAWILSPKDLVRLTGSSFYSLIGTSNIYFWQQYGNYFAGNTSEAPLLHTWSLGVEEQYYLIWPLLLSGIFKLPTRWRLPLITALAGLLLAISQFGVARFASASYYLLPTRAFELLVGSMLALAPARALWNDRWNEFTSAIGLTLVLSPSLFFNRDTSFPGINAVWPCIGTAILIFSGPESTIARRVLSSPPMVATGLISYSLYLWHWPLIAYANYLRWPLDLPNSILLLLTAVIFATATWRWIETPMRQTGRQLTFWQVLGRRFAAPVGALALLWVATALYSGFPGRFDPRVAEFESIQAKAPEVLRAGCHVPTAAYATRPDAVHCRLGAPLPNGVQAAGALIGDSYANHYTGMLDEMGKASGVSLIDYTMDGCPPILDFDTGKSGVYAQRCKERNLTAYRWIEQQRYKQVILAASWPRSEQAGQQLILSVGRLHAAGIDVTIVLGNQGFDGADSCPIRHLMAGTEPDCTAPEKPMPAYFKELRAAFPDVHFIDPNPTYCSEGRCSSVRDRTPLFRDATHFNDVGSRWIGRRLLSWGIRL